ncbi:uncharacterized protein LOC114523384 [Dendronephthya gigantea]|uniref:uncharacterized protein LOC114523384 n=1 Tax=Dendronephthya gigantea TaxID=151771 RepID=UPI00106DC0BA|nr:uncharacterized protein LOC114523384 [Dendronephthya gigantea]XP_028400082.1 uncharacterized protein LOC114523384 [Dendronephthya gigantea]
MTSRKDNSNGHAKTNDDILIEEFAKEFFGTDKPDNEILQPEITEVKRKDCENERGKYGENYSSKTQNAGKEKRGNGPKAENTDKNFSKNNDNKHPFQNEHQSDSRQSLKRFRELSNEFITLSNRLYNASMPKVSEKLTQVLAEKQRLVKLLLQVGAPAPSKTGSKRGETRFREEPRQRKGDSKQEIGMPKKTKSVHWSDEHLGGKIIHDPSLYTEKRPNSNPSHKTPTKKPGRNHKNDLGPPPRYKMVDSCTQTRRSSERSDCDLPSTCFTCKMRIDHEMEYVEEILNEAAELRREACYMIWRAHYLEQLCDADGLVKHVYRSNSSIPTLPRYSQLYR